MSTSDNTVQYKDTLNLPVTDFPMKGNLPEKEPQMIARWQEKQIYHKILEKNRGKKIFTMPDGPPYANGDIHIGHTLNKCLKDFVVKYKNMSGRAATFVPGWDCHGLPIEQNVNKALGSKRREKSDSEIRTLCRAEAGQWMKKQEEQFKRLGIMADWKNPYLTMQPEYEAEIVRELARVLERGLLYLGTKPVYWCPTLQTALAEAEVEYHQHKSPSIYVRFPFRQGVEKFGKFAKPVHIAIWTTTPWTLPANQGVAMGADIEYGFFEASDEFLLMAKDLAEAFSKETGIELKPPAKFFKGSEFERLQAEHPFYNRPSLIVLGEHVSLDATGVVHTAPGHGQDDYVVGLRYGLKVLSPVDAAGQYTDEVPEYKGMKIFDANPVIVDRLRNDGRLIAHKIIEHSYPHNWRSKTPLIFRATPQWFMAMDKPGHSIRQKALAEIEKTQFVPEWGRNRLQSMVENRPDWVLSRQRIWGVPIAIFYCTSCQEPLASPEVMYRVADAMEKEDGIEAYFRHDARDFTAGATCGKCGGKEFAHGKDILDVWFDSGACHAAVQARRQGMEVPADLYLEGSDQHRGWFQTSLLSSVASRGIAPYKALLTHGFVMDDKGRKMSKSLGNVVDPLKTCSSSGAEILRLWSAYEDYGQDLTCGPESMSRVTETYRRFRNTMRFMLGNISDFKPATDAVPFSKMTPLDQWALGRLHDLTEKVTAGYESYEFHKVYHALNHFFTVELSAGYLDMLKDRLYTWKKTGVERRSSQTVLYLLLDYLIRMMAPITSFLSEEVLTYMPGEKPESIFLLDFPKANSEWRNPQLQEEFAGLYEIRSDVSKSLEELRQSKVIGSGLDAQVTVTADGARHQLLKKYETLLPEFFIVSQVRLNMGNYGIESRKADGSKCERCWYHDPATGMNAKFPHTCPKCVKALS